jgi:hypothetical protein
MTNGTLSLAGLLKQAVLRQCERAGYVVYRVEDHQQLAKELENAKSDLKTAKSELEQARHQAREAARKLAEADRDFRLARERDRQELELARAETWEFRQHARG